MPKGMQAIYTQTVGSGGAGEINFLNIPQTYTDLKIVVSARSPYSTNPRIYMGMQFNGVTTSIYNNKVISGGGNSVSTGNNYTGNTEFYIGEVNSSTSLANSYSTTTVDIPNYTAGYIKNMTSSTVYGNNIQEAFQVLCAGIFINPAPITSVRFYIGGGNTLSQHSTATLYGIAR